MTGHIKRTAEESHRQFHYLL